MTPSMTRRLTTAIQSRNAQSFRGIMLWLTNRGELKSLQDWLVESSEFLPFKQREWAVSQFNNADNNKFKAQDIVIKTVLYNHFVKLGFISGKDFVINEEVFYISDNAHKRLLDSLDPESREHFKNLINKHFKRMAMPK